MPKAAKGKITHDSNGLYKELNQLLYKPALPIHLYEKRGKFKSVLEIGVYGNYEKLDSDKQNIIEARVYVKIDTKDIGKVDVHAFVLKKGEQQDDKKNKLIGTGRNVIYLQNGQVHAQEGVSFITKGLGFSYLKDSMLIALDCSEMNTNSSQDIFMANRSTTKKSEKLDILKKEIAEMLKSNEILKKLNDERKNAILLGGDDKKDNELINSILSKIPLGTLTDVLNMEKGGDIDVEPEPKKNPKDKAKKDTTPFEGKRFPAIFKINLPENDEGKKIKSIPLNKNGHITFETNVEENYFYRPEEPGELKIQILGGKNETETKGGNAPGKPNKIEDYFDVRISGPSNGTIKLILKPTEEMKVDDERR